MTKPEAMGYHAVSEPAIMSGASMSYIVKVGFDERERRYFVLFSDIPGLNIEADTFEAFVEATQDAAPDLVGDHPQGSSIRFEREVVLAA
jgi:hypothetical protein